jgi:hypothetical protein
MASVKDLHTAIAKGFVALAEKLANDLRESGVDISKEIDYAKMLSGIKGGSWTNVYNAIA